MKPSGPHEEFKEAVELLAEGAAAQVPDSLAELLRAWVAIQREREPQDTRAGVPGADSGETLAGIDIDRLVRATGERFHLLFVGEPGSVSCAISTTEAAVRITKNMLEGGRTVSLCSLSSNSGVTCDMDYETGNGPELSVSAWGRARGALAGKLSSD